MVLNHFIIECSHNLLVKVDSQTGRLPPGIQTLGVVFLGRCPLWRLNCTCARLRWRCFSQNLPSSLMGIPFPAILCLPRVEWALSCRSNFFIWYSSPPVPIIDSDSYISKFKLLNFKSYTGVVSIIPLNFGH